MAANHNLQGEMFEEQFEDLEPFEPSPNLRQVLGLPADLFLVQPSELVRKATDELTLGLHLHTLYVLIHAAANGKPVEYRVKNAPEMQDVKGRRRMVKMTRGFKMNLQTISTCAQSMNEFIRSSVSFDFRSLLNNMRNVQRSFRTTETYYTNTVIDQIENLRKCANFFYHRNSLIPPDDVVQKAIRDANWNAAFDYDEVDRRELAMARLFFKNLFVDLPALQPLSDRYKREKDACKELYEASLEHFKSAGIIKKVFESLFGEQRATQPSETVEDTLGRIKQDIEKSNSASIQFAVFALWTRFGTPVKHDGRASTESSGAIISLETKKRLFSRLHYATVQRHIVDPSKLGSAGFVCAEKSFKIDPIGITNLDVLNRAMDTANRALRLILYEALCNPTIKVPARIAKRRKDFRTCLETMKENEKKNFRVLRSRTMAGIAAVFIQEKIPQEQSATSQQTIGNDKKLLPSTSSQIASNAALSQNEKQEREKGKDDGQLLVEEFNRRMRTNASNGDECLRNFILFDPHLADPRFIGEVLAYQQAMFPLADDLIDLRDDASHQQNLTRPQYLTRDHVLKQVKMLTDLVKDVGEKLGVAFTDFREVKALEELTKLIEYYSDWRKKQHYASNLVEKAEPLWRWLATETSEKLKKTHDSLSPEVLEALRTLLSFYPPVRNRTRLADENASTATTCDYYSFNPFAVLECEEGEDEEVDGNEDDDEDRSAG